MDVNLQPKGFTAQGTYSPDNLIAGCCPDLVGKPIVIKSGSGKLVRGTVLEVSSTAGKYQAVTTDANAKYVLAEDVDATSADVTSIAYINGMFNSARVTLGSGATLAGVTAALEPLSIILVAAVSN